MTIMWTNAFARSRSFWVQMAWGVLVSLTAALGALLYVAVMNIGITLLWPKAPGPELFSGPVRILVIMTLAGLVVGLIHHFLEAREVDVFEAVAKGGLEPRPVPGAILVSLATLIGGFSLGPEVPTGMLAGGLATWVSKKKKLAAEAQTTNVVSGVMGAYGGLFTSPFAVLLMPIELAHPQTPAFYGTVTIAAISGVIGFGIFYAAGGEAFSEVIRILDLPAYSVRLWHLPLAIVLGVLGAVLALIFGFCMRTFGKLAAPLNRRPILRGAIGGFLLGLLGMALPLTLFLGTAGLELVTKKGVEMGLVMVILYVFAKILATSGALSTGFIGGPIFPLLFVGGTAGTALNIIFPDIPLALAVGCMMAAVPGALLPVPLSLAVIVLLITGIPATEAIPVFLAVIVAYGITHGLGLVGHGAAKEQPHAAEASTAS
jgi:H+/Cl- antiporter ClcA